MLGCLACRKKHVNFYIIFVAIIISLLLFSNVKLQNYVNLDAKTTILAQNRIKFVYAEEQDDILVQLEESTNEAMSGLDLSDIEEYFNQNESYFNSAFGVTSFRDLLLKIVQGELLTDFNSVTGAIFSVIKQNISSILSPLVLILVIALICGLYKHLKPKTNENSVESAILFICYSVIITILSYLVAKSLSLVYDSINKMKSQMDISMPIILTLMTSAGANISVKAYSPMVLFLSNMVSTIFTSVLLPIAVIIFVISLVSNLSKQIKLGGLADFFSSVFKWIIGLMFTVYLGFMTIQGITASSADGIGFKTAKFAIKNYVPMLGGYISDGFEVARVGSIIIKNALGFGGIIILISTVAVPILYICTLQLSIKFISGIGEPMGSNVGGLLSGVEKSLSKILVVLIGVFMMYFVMLILFICSVSGAFWCRYLIIW